MTYYDIIKIDEDGKVDLPPDSAFDIGVSEGAYFLLEVNPAVKEARLERVALPKTELVEIELILENKTGVLSHISSELAEHKVNILFNESEEVNREEAVLVIVIDVSKMDFSLEELKERISALDEVIDISIKEID